ncbi:MAG: hypothetical protein ACPIOQ_20060, partial [Promethearchaeia archaeon]
MVTNMPNVSGWEVLTRLRGMAEAAELPVFAVRAAGVSKEAFDIENQEIAAKLGGMGAGFAGSIQKPFNVAAIQELLKQIGPAPGFKKPATIAVDALRASDKLTPVRESSTKKALLRILVVEDHWANQKLLEAMLKQHGHEVLC